MTIKCTSIAIKNGLSILGIIIGVFFNHCDAVSQNVIDIDDWLNKKKTTIGSGLQSMDNNTFSPSWIRELEFRTETEDFLFDKQEYLIRYRPSFPGERAAQSRLIDVSREEWQINQLNFQNDINRYLLDELLIIRQINEELELLNELNQIYQDQRLLISDQIYDGNFNLKDLSQIDNDIRSTQSKIKDHQLRIDLIQQRDDLPDTDQLIPIREISQQLEERNLTRQSSINIAERSFELKKVEAERELEKIEGGRIFDFIQLRYNGPHADLLSERLALSVSIQFPNDSRSKLRVEELKVEQLIRQQEFNLEQKLDSIKLSRDLDEFTLLIQKWSYNQEIITQQSDDLNNLINQGVNVEFDTPEVILYQKEQLIKLKQDQLSLERDIYRLYLDLLERTTILGENRFYSFIVSN
jgi:hypothetical protein